jgi:S-adenosyl-L-methionine hydrolase (adenosine-forming)
MPRATARGPLITLTTDFGLEDHFVGTMKGVILSIAPRARIVDITHQVSPFEIAQGGFLLAAAAGYFPPKTVHVAVVDPGVGTSRRPIVVESAGQYFVAPDNGLLSMICERGKCTVRAATARRYMLDEMSATFHGRDVFAPIAAHLATGTPPARLGKRIDDYLRCEFHKPVHTGKRIWTGAILHIDHFGNIVTNFHAAEFADLATRPFAMTVGFERTSRLASTYGDLPPGELALVAGSTGYYEIVYNQASAAKLLGVAIGAPIELTRVSA